MVVSDLIIPQTRLWNVGVINSVMSSVDRNHILKTLLFEVGQQDQRIWQHEPNGIYSVKSGYKVSLQQSVDVHAIQSDGNWNLVLNLQAPPKVRTFLWKICRDCLPTRVRLQCRGVNFPRRCGLCNNEDEDSLHLFFSSANTIQCWQRIGLWGRIQVHMNTTTTTKTIIFDMLQSLDQQMKSVFACLLWSIWKQRNDMVWRNDNTSCVIVCERGATILTNWQNAQTRQNQGHQKQQNNHNNWQKPSVGWYKCNVDASFSHSRNRVGIGVFIRDDNGSFVLAKTEWFSPILSVDEGEATGLLCALRWVKDLGLNNVTFELDSKRVVDSFLSDRRDESDLGAIIRECKNTFSSFFHTLWSLLGDKPMRSLTILRGWHHLMLVSICSSIYLIVFKLLSLMK